MARKSKAAYFLVDLSALSAAQRQEVIEDAYMGGGDYGVVVVEEVHNGPAVSPIFGVYIGVGEQKWDEAKAEFGAAEVDEDDEEVLREQADRAAEANADAVRKAEEAELRAITKEEEIPPPVVTQNKNKNK